MKWLRSEVLQHAVMIAMIIVGLALACSIAAARHVGMPA